MLIRKVEKFLRLHAMPPTKFGRLAANDPCLVRDMRNGREPHIRLERRLEHFMNNYPEPVHA